MAFEKGTFLKVVIGSKYTDNAESNGSFQHNEQTETLCYFEKGYNAFCTHWECDANPNPLKTGAERLV